MGRFYNVHNYDKSHVGIIIITMKCWTNPFVMHITIPCLSLQAYSLCIYHNLTWHLTINCIDIVVCLLFNTPSENIYLALSSYSWKIACLEVFYHTNDFLLYKKYLVSNNQNLLVWDPKFLYIKSFELLFDYGYPLISILCNDFQIPL